MRILVDADACPVKDIIVKVAKEYKLDVLMFMDTSHIIDDGYSKNIIVGKGRDSVDFALVNEAKQGDIVVTQDYGVAAMVLSKGTFAINQNGLIFTNQNIDSLLMQRYVNYKVRESGGKICNHKKEPI
ncbi:YaiI/YqxD family protein [Caloramator sp. mosi_1]|uniref:YaiI/YqxD family protein n=1 Tax=Caloramator sp. mosi_1 TaxID=3023090 RepID=UPI0023617B89|nr:YaiI/YqxD family protein [Caloramator sp. mosi_1]WDC83262.1 YaiI/YqxD family protein [Caloramator sp. mosi_1]